MLLAIWIACHRVRIGGRRIAAVVAIAAAGAALAVPGSPGLTARYFATADIAEPHERSTEYPRAAFTRIDRRIDFGRPGRDFPLAFFNDHTRFNFMRAGEPDRRFLAFAGAWAGWWHVAGATSIFVHAPQATAQISVDNVPVLNSIPQSGEQTAEVMLTPGWHRLHITFSSPYGAPREFSAGEMRGSRRIPFGEANTRTERISGAQEIVAGVLAFAKPVADAVALAWLSILAVLLMLRRAGEVRFAGWQAHTSAFALCIAAGAIEALHFAWPWATRLRLMVAGDDTMTYETYARDILFNGILMNGGAAPGHGEPFYYQAFYPYFLAATHAAFGESFFGALFLQRLLVVFTALLLTRVAMRLRGDAVWPTALIVSAAFAFWKSAPIAADLLNESVYVPLLCAWLVAMVELCANPSAGATARAGLAGGLAAITRSTAMLSWPLVWPACVIALKGTARRGRMAAAMIVCTLAVFSTIAVRNGIVSHTFAPTPTELGITLYGGNPPPPDLKLDAGPRTAIYQRLGIGGYTQEVVEYALAAPGRFAAHLGRKALFALGFYEPYAEGWGYSPIYIATWVSALAGVLLLMRTAALPRSAVLIPLMIAATQYAAVVIVYPKGERLILPIHTMLIPYASIAAYELWTRALRPSR